MTTEYRKISVGKDFPDGSIHYQVGKNVNSNYVITKIAESLKYRKEGKMAYDIFITGTDGTVLWKTVVDMPVVVENNIDFE